ncbi:amino acid permease [Nocardia terpenica]|uniref:Amino acid permease n=1 Tax=Nocardia terpenica TaxID=455432 RepID=A0A291RHB3_9NOCA|nr:amino acid permease [Nocardia terpenica]
MVEAIVPQGISVAPATELGTGSGPARLTRSIGVLGGTLLTLSCLTPASSLFVIVPGLFTTQGTGTVLALGIAAVLCIGVAFCYSELGTLAPSSGGEYAMVGTVVGRFLAWLVFVIALVVVLVIPPIMAVGTAAYLSSVLSVDHSLTGAIVMLLSVGMGLLQLRTNAWVTGAFMVLEVVAAAVVAGLGFAHVHRPAGSLLHPQVLGASGPSPLSGLVLVSGLAVALFVLQGFTTAVYLAEEMRQPRRTVVRTVLWTLGVGAVVIIVPTTAVVLGAPDLKALTDGDLVAMVTGWSNSAVATFISLCIALAIVNATIVMVIQNSRVLYASARDRAWPTPVNRALSNLNRLGSPWIATLVVGLPGAALCFVDLTLLNQVTSVVVAALYLAVAVAALTTRRARHRNASAWRMPWWPVVPVVVIATLIYVLTQQPIPALLITAAVIAVAIAYWVVYLRRSPADRWVIMMPTE